MLVFAHLRPSQRCQSRLRLQPRRWITRPAAPRLRSLTPGAILALLLALAITGLTACSSAAPPDKTLTLGTALPITGASAVVGLAMQQAVDLAVKQNTRLPNGYSLTSTHLDENSVSGAAAVDTLASDSEVVGVVGPLASDTALAMLPGVEQSHLATISPTATLPGLTQASAATTEGLAFSALHPQGAPVAFFRLPATDGALGKVAADVATAPTASHGLNARAVFVVDDGTVSGAAQVAAFDAELKARGGNVAGHATLTQGADDNTQTTVSAIVDAYPDLVFYAGDEGAGAELRGTLSLTGAPQLPLLTIGPAAAAPGWSAAVGVTAAAAYTTALLPAPAPATLPDATATAAFTAAYQAAYHTAPLPLSALAYDAAMVEIAAIKSVIAAGKTPTRAAVLVAVSTSTYHGLIGAIAFDANGDNTAPPDFAVYTCDMQGTWTYQTSVKAS